jgi:DNA-binding GntR family transcriptional regulator
VTHQHNRGFEVPRLTQETLAQISQVRRPLEVLALEWARPRVGDAEIQRLIELKADLLRAFRSGGIFVCATPDFAFHSAVWEYSGNPWLQAALRRISMPYFAYVSAFHLGRPDHSEDLMDQMHQRYIDFLAGRSAESADECVQFHLGYEA